MPGGAKAVIHDGDRWCPFIFMCLFLSPILHERQPVDDGVSRGLRSTLRLSRSSTTVSSSCSHYERLSHSAAHISAPTSPSRRNVRRDAGQIALSISDACSAPSLTLFLSLARSFSLSFAPLRLDGVKCAPPYQHAPLIFHPRCISYFR